jgi:DNA replication licensing factor MCM2
LAILLTNSPTEVLKIFDDAAFDVVLTGFEFYDSVKTEIHVRMTDVPATDSLRDLRYWKLFFFVPNLIFV